MFFGTRGRRDVAPVAVLAIAAILSPCEGKFYGRIALEETDVAKEG